jgi:hypothetical protein
VTDPRRLRAVAIVCATLTAGSLLTACSLAGGGDRAADRPHGSAVTSSGEGTFTFTGYEPLADRPVEVRYAAPPHDLDTATILIVIPGTGRDAKEYRADWEAEARDRHMIVLVPEFTKDEFPGASSYNLGNMVDEDGEAVPEDRWSFRLIEALFDYVVKDVGSDQNSYALFGHSAGAQFIHRFVEFVPDNRVSVAVAANAGWYTMPDDRIAFPYGLKGSPSSERDLRGAFGTRLVVLLGADDIDPEATNLRRDEQADAQGTDRLDRGVTFYQRSRDVAEQHSLPFAWTLVVVPGIAHSHSDMAAAAAPLILDAQRGRP